MSKLTKKSIILFLIVFGISWAIREALPLSVTWAEDEINGQYQYFVEHKDSFNVIFLGSSRIYRGFDPMVFDQTVTDIDEATQTRSFNLGAPAYGFPKTELLLEDLIENNSQNLDYILLELAHVSKPVSENMHTPEVIYWHHFNNTKFILSYWFDHPRYTLEETIRFSSQTAVSFIENKLNIGLGPHILDYLSGKTIPPKLGFNNNGFASLDDAAVNSAALRSRSEKIQNNPQLVNWMFNNVNTAIARGEENLGNYNAEFVEKALKFINLAEEYNVELIFVLPPNIGEDYDILVPIYNQIPAKNRISRADPLLFPEYYTEENIFDLGHLNKQGAEIFTASVAKEFFELVANKNINSLEILRVEKGKEYVDIRNRGDTEINLENWVLFSDRNGRSCELKGSLRPNNMIRVWSQSIATDAITEFARLRHYACPNQEVLWNNKLPAIASIYDSNGNLTVDYREITSQLIILEVDKLDEFLVLTNEGDSNQNLDGWQFYSVHSNLVCSLSGSIDSGQSLRVWSAKNGASSNTPSNDLYCLENRPIWNNKFASDTVLLDQDGIVRFEFQE